MPCDDFDDCHDEIAAAGIDFIGKRPIYGHYLQGEGCSRAFPTRTVTPGHQSHHRWSWRGNQGFEVMNLHPMFRYVLYWFRNIGSYGSGEVRRKYKKEGALSLCRKQKRTLAYFLQSQIIDILMLTQSSNHNLGKHFFVIKTWSTLKSTHIISNI